MGINTEEKKGIEALFSRVRTSVMNISLLPPTPRSLTEWMCVRLFLMSRRKRDRDR